MSPHSCCNKQKVKRGLWSPEEDEKLIKYISSHGHGCWSSIPSLAGLQRCGKSCRLRWINYLRPDLKRGSFSQQEAALIIQLHRILGNRWAQIAKYLPGRTDNEVKNFWNSSIKKRLITSHQNLFISGDYHPNTIFLDPSTNKTTFFASNSNPNPSWFAPQMLDQPIFFPNHQQQESSQPVDLDTNVASFDQSSWADPPLISPPNLPSHDLATWPSSLQYDYSNQLFAGEEVINLVDKGEEIVRDHDLALNYVLRPEYENVGIIDPPANDDMMAMASSLSSSSSSSVLSCEQGANSVNPTVSTTLLSSSWR